MEWFRRTKTTIHTLPDTEKKNLQTQQQQREVWLKRNRFLFPEASVKELCQDTGQGGLHRWLLGEKKKFNANTETKSIDWYFVLYSANNLLVRNQIHVQGCFGFHGHLQTEIICKKPPFYFRVVVMMETITTQPLTTQKTARIHVTYKVKWEFRLCWAWVGLVLLETEWRRFTPGFIFRIGNLVKSRQEPYDTCWSCIPRFEINWSNFLLSKCLVNIKCEIFSQFNLPRKLIFRILLIRALFFGGFLWLPLHGGGQSWVVRAAADGAAVQPGAGHRTWCTHKPNLSFNPCDSIF